ncbi:MAG: branched-chain amino acid ABC transporter permease [Desulfobacteraceae bacterium]|jgi:branched-chain amino acid transport system permease protein|nr:branched-chain amino acid ABC transporter permease [Desulfobacteraceae bacterium]
MMKNFQKGSNGINRVWQAVVFAALLLLPFILSPSWLSITTEILILSIAACGLNLLIGYCGRVNFGPAGLYGVGAYATGLLLEKTGIPFGVAMIGGPIMAGIIALPIGWFCVRCTSHYFALLSLAFGQIIWATIHSWYSFTGGDDGIAGIRAPDFLLSISSYYYFSLVIAAICLIVLWMISNSSFGKTLKAIRENQQRADYIGINARRYLLIAFIIQGFFLGVSGSLYCGFSHAVFPVYASFLKGNDILIPCILGGIYNFTGPIVGVAVYIFLSKIISVYTMYWLLFLGVIIVFVVLFLRGGIVGFISEKLFPVMQRRGVRGDAES